MTGTQPLTKMRVSHLCKRPGLADFLLPPPTSFPPGEFLFSIPPSSNSREPISLSLLCSSRTCFRAANDGPKGRRRERKKGQKDDRKTKGDRFTAS